MDTCIKGKYNLVIGFSYVLFYYFPAQCLQLVMDMSRLSWSYNRFAAGLILRQLLLHDNKNGLLVWILQLLKIEQIFIGVIHLKFWIHVGGGDIWSIVSKA